MFNSVVDFSANKGMLKANQKIWQQYARNTHKTGVYSRKF